MGCLNNCNDRGFCGANDTCVCILSYYEKDCSVGANELEPGLWAFHRIWTIITYSICGIICILGLISSSRQFGTRASMLFFNFKQFAIVMILVMCIDVVIYFAVDPRGYNYIVPRLLNEILFGLAFPLMFTIYLFVLLHWAEIYDNAMHRLRQEEMLEKINQKYKSNISLQTILTNMNGIHKLRIPFAILLVTIWIMQVVRDFMYALVFDTHVRTIHSFYLSFVLLVEFIGLVYYGRKLISIMPDDIAARTKRYTRLFLIQMAVFGVSWIITGVAFSFAIKSPKAYIIGDWVFRFFFLVTDVVMLSTFFKPNRTFPYLFTSTSKKGSADDTSGGTTSLPMVDDFVDSIDSPSNQASSFDLTGSD